MVQKSWNSKFWLQMLNPEPFVDFPALPVVACCAPASPTWLVEPLCLQNKKNLPRVNCDRLRDMVMIFFGFPTSNFWNIHNLLGNYYFFRSRIRSGGVTDRWNAAQTPPVPFPPWFPKRFPDKEFFAPSNQIQFRTRSCTNECEATQQWNSRPRRSFTEIKSQTFTNWSFFTKMVRSTLLWGGV